MPKIYAGCILIIAALLAGPETVAAQSELFEISGTLTPPAGGTPCVYCQVQLEDMLGASRTTLTDGNGDFAFRNLKDDSFRIRVSLRGYEDVSLFVKLNSQKTRVAIDLKPLKSATVGQVLNVESAIDTQPKKAVELFRKATDNHRKNKTDEAMRQFEEVLRMAPRFFAAHQGLGMSYQALGRLVDAEREFQTARDLDGSSAEPLLHLSDVYLLRNEWGAAARISVDAIRRDPQSAAGFFNLGLALYCGSMFALAKDSLEKALSADPKMDQARLLLINVYLRLREGNRALDQINLYLERSPDRSQRATLSSIRAQLRKGSMPAEDFEVSFPIQLGETVRQYACRD
jgi:tetratricopeptide (TPR) repeat protein